jgi:hypothetical protein
VGGGGTAVGGLLPDPCTGLGVAGRGAGGVVSDERRAARRRCTRGRGVGMAGAGADLVGGADLRWRDPVSRPRGGRAGARHGAAHRLRVAGHAWPRCSARACRWPSG